VQSFTVRMPLLMATSAFGLARRRWSSAQQCYLHCLPVHVPALRLVYWQAAVFAQRPDLLVRIGHVRLCGNRHGLGVCDVIYRRLFILRRHCCPAQPVVIREIPGAAHADLYYLCPTLQSLATPYLAVKLNDKKTILAWIILFVNKFVDQLVHLVVNICDIRTPY